MSIDEGKLFQGCLSGDARAWKQLVTAYAGLVFSVARRQGLREDQCEDVAQTVFSALSRRLASIHDLKALAAWLITTTQRESWRVARAMRTNPGSVAGSVWEAERAAPEQQPDEELMRLERSRHVLAALEELGGRCRDLLAALFLETNQADYEELSRRLDIPMGSIGPTRARCLGKLAQILQGFEGS